MKLLLDVLRSVEFLANGPPELPAEFMALGRTRTLPRNHVLWRAGQRPESIVIPITGEVAALGRDSGGRGICYAFFGTGESVGLLAAVDGMTEPREVRVIRGGEFFVVDRATFLRFLDVHAEAHSLVTGFIGRLFRRSLDERDRDVFLPVHARVARFLLERACVRRSDGARILLRESQPEIAIRLGSVREVIAREMASFADQGLLRRTRHAVFVVDWAGLWDKAACDADAGECSCEAETSARRTQRFFLPTVDGGAARIAEETQICGEYLPGFRGCVARGCPLAVAATCGTTGAPEFRAVPTAHRAKAARMPASRLPVHPPATPRSDEAAPETVGCTAAHAVRDRIRGEMPSRTPQEEMEIRRRIDAYRQRVAGIESKFGDEGDVPDDETMFGESSRE